MEVSNLNAPDSSGGFVVDESLLAMEQMKNRASPDLWPEQIPGMSDYEAQNSQRSVTSKTQSPTKAMDSEDKALLLHLSKLTPAEFVNEVKKLQDVAHQLGLEEAKEMTRGKMLEVLIRKKEND